MKDRRDGWIYAAQEDGTPLVKIGYSRDVQWRMVTLKAQLRARHSLIAAVYVERLALQAERRIHRILSAQHIEREWFYLHMRQERLEALVQQAIQELLAEESQRALTRDQARLRMHWGNPLRRMAEEELRALARALGVSFLYLVGEDEDSEQFAAATL
jgi:hypothetical protein